MPPSPAQTELFGTVFVEIINPGGGAVRLPGWHTRLWPVARLGDQTLEAWPVAGQARAGQVDVRGLFGQLQGAGVTPLSVRLRPGQIACATLPEPAPRPTLEAAPPLQSRSCSVRP